MQPLTFIGHTDLISLFKDDLRYLTVPSATAQITMAGMKSLRPLAVMASLCPFDWQGGSDRPFSPGEAWQQWLAFRSTVEQSPSFRVVLSGEKIDPTDTEHIQLLMHLEGAHPVEQPSDLAQFPLLGGRAFSLTWNNNNQYAGGALSDGHLTELGKELLAEVAKTDLLLDISHLNEASFWEVLETYPGKVFASHSNAREITDSPRNLTKRQLTALRERGVWVGVTFAKTHLTTHSQPTVDDVVLHLEALTETLGSGLVGLGTDYDGIISALPSGLEHIGKLEHLFEKLRTLNWSDDQIANLRGQNFLHFYQG